MESKDKFWIPAVIERKKEMPNRDLITDIIHRKWKYTLLPT